MTQHEKHIEAYKMAEYIIKNKATIRDTAKHFKTSKSTVHYRITDMKNYDRDLYNQVHDILQFNWDEKSYRGAVGLWGDKIKHSKRKECKTT